MLLADKITNAPQNRDFVVGIHLDFSKAFDTVNHQILMQNLYKHGIFVSSQFLPECNVSCIMVFLDVININSTIQIWSIL